MLRKLPKPKKLSTTHKRAKTAQPSSKSSSIQTHSYNGKTGHLTLTFPGDRTYRYEGVPTDLAKDFAASDSKGRFLHSNIAGKFDATKI